MTIRTSPFLHPGSVSTVDQLSIIHLKRDLQNPTILRDQDEEEGGYSEGKVVNTRFGSFPHSTLIGKPWGSQVLASKVDTGSRGRRGQPQEKKRKREDNAFDDANKKQRLDDGDSAADGSTTVTARDETEVLPTATGFIHLLPPTPENWTNSLPHRTQVVYTPDYSYILHRIRARPGTSLIEAGAGSGSFSHASARAVFSGYSSHMKVNDEASRKLGRVWSYEFHQQRHQKLEEEIREHGLDDLVHITHRDVCEDGFLVDGKSPGADAIFLDLPAPWLALPHLSRSKPPSTSSRARTPTMESDSALSETPYLSPLNPTKTVYICTFSPCIEQVQKTVSVMRRLGWVDIEMVEIAAKRFEIRRERIGLENQSTNPAQHGMQPIPSTVDEAVSRLIEVEGTIKDFHENGEIVESGKRKRVNANTKEKIIESLVERKVYKEGRLVHRSENEVRTHTSYLVFAILPMEWSEEDERKAAEKWPVKRKDNEDDKVIGVTRRQQKRLEQLAAKEGGKPDGNGVSEPPPLSKKQQKRNERQARKDREARDKETNGEQSAPSKELVDTAEHET